MIKVIKKNISPRSPIHKSSLSSHSKPHSFTYLLEFLRSPRSMGSVYPSSTHLTDRLTQYIENNSNSKNYTIYLVAVSCCVTESLFQ